MRHELRLSVAPSRTWRNKTERNFLKSKEWQNIRKKILEKYDYGCAYCGYKPQKYQIVHHIDGNPMNNSENNLEVVCPECNLILHCGFAGLQNKIKIFKSLKLTQLEIIQETRKLRKQGLSDKEIIKQLGLIKTNIDPVELANQLLKGKKISENLVGFIVKK